MKNSRITVEVHFPALSGKYDFVLDSEMTVGEATEKIYREIIQHEKADFLTINPEDFYLFTDTSQLPLDPDISISEYGICSGSRLMLI